MPLKGGIVKLLIICLIILLIVFLSYLLYLKLTYIHKEITNGEAYGFSIGDSKELAYQKAKQAFQGKIIFIDYPIFMEDVGDLTLITFSDKEYAYLKDRKNWRFYYNKTRLDILVLIFSNNKLTSIVRHRQKIELP